MAKIYTVLDHVELVDGRAKLYYTATIERDNPAESDPTTDVFGQDYGMNSLKSAKENEDGLKLQLASYAASIGVKLTTGDVLVHGALVVKDAASYADKTNGITSDKDATVLIDAPVDVKPVGLMASLRDRFTSMWG